MNQEIYRPSPGSTIYLLGICGTGMAALAGLLREKGYKIEGSDSQAYPPMSDVLRDMGISIRPGYCPENLSPVPDLVIIGNVIRADNPEARHVISTGIPYLSFSEALSLFFLEDRRSLVVAGTHGKTTTSTLLVSAIKALKEDPGFMIGGVPKAFGSGFHIGTSPWFVVEGDEYDTAFFDKSPKFLHYRPYGVILTSLEFDHADIYPDLEAVKQAFFRLVSLIPPDGILVACADWPAVREVCSQARCKVVTYGIGSGCDWQLGHFSVGQRHTEFFPLYRGEAWGRVEIRLPGRHNALNTLGVLALSMDMGMERDACLKGLAACQGVKRRQEFRGEIAGITIIDDFAHHPGAVRETLTALRAVYPDRRLIAAFEPRTNTNRRAVFQEVYPYAFASADRVLVREVVDPEKAPPGDRFSSKRLVKDLRDMGTDASYFPDVESMLRDLLAGLSTGDVVVALSNGDFGGLIERLISGLSHGTQHS